MMEPIPFFYDSINRNAIVIKPKPVFFDWINSIDPDHPVSVEKEGTVYLVKEKASNEAIQRWLQKNFDEVFQNEMNNWYIDDDCWIKNRTYKKFKEYFDIEIHSMILDIEESPIFKD